MTDQPTQPTFQIWEGERWKVEQMKNCYTIHNGDFIIATLDFVRWRPEQAKAYADLIGAAPETEAERDRLKVVNEGLVKALEEAEEYFDQRADAEYLPDHAAPVGNKEMDLLTLVRAALDEARQS